MAAFEQYISLYESELALLLKPETQLLNKLRPIGYEALAHMNFPSKKVERYRYTDVEAAFAPNYGINLSGLKFGINTRDMFRCNVPGLSTQMFFVENDRLRTDLMPHASMPEGVLVMSLAEACMSHPDLVQKYYCQLATPEADSITALNTLLCQDGLLIYLPAGIELHKPIQVVNVLRSTVPLMMNRRVIVVAEEGAKAQLLFCDHAQDNVDFLTTQVTEVYVGSNASIEMYDLEETNAGSHRFANLQATIGEGGTLSHYAMTLTCGLTRNQTDIVLAAPHATANLYGCAITDKQQHIENNTLITHHAPQCESRELYKYVVDEQSVGAFAGRILVEKDAQQTVSQETNANLVCTREARMYTQPMLEIYADDVQCSHGSTVGQLSDDALFYMRQRGIDEDEARTLLKQAFATEVINHIELEALRDRLHHLVDKRFRGQLGSCQHCIR